MVRRSQNDRVKRTAAACTIDGRSCARRPWRRAAARPSTEPVRQDSAERRQLTVMFCDLVGSTALLARLDPEDLGGHGRLSSLLHGVGRAQWRFRRQVLGRRVLAGRHAEPCRPFAGHCQAGHCGYCREYATASRQSHVRSACPSIAHRQRSWRPLSESFMLAPSDQSLPPPVARRGPLWHRRVSRMHRDGRDDRQSPSG
jgi:hypothetical protein